MLYCCVNVVGRMKKAKATWGAGRQSWVYGLESLSNQSPRVRLAGRVRNLYDSTSKYDVYNCGVTLFTYFIFLKMVAFK